VRPHVQSLDLLYREASAEIRLLTGPVKRLYDQHLEAIRDIDDLTDGGKYLCCAGEQPCMEKLDHFLSDYVVWPTLLHTR